jgi:PAS domain S-box-containing protein
MAADVTHREEMEQVLRESRERLSLALDGAELGMWDWKIETGELVINERWAEMLGYTLEEIDPHVRVWMSLLHPDDAPAVMEVLDAHFEGRTPVYQTEHRLRTKSGKWKWILDTGKVLLRDEDGKPLRAVGTHQDITDRKRAEEELKRYADNLKRSNEELERFAHVISHDLSEPARMVEGYLELLERRYQRRLDEKAREYIDYAVDGAARMQEMISALLNLFRVDTQGERFLPTDVERVVERTLTSLGRVIEEAGAEVFYDPLPTVMADKAQLAQVFQNLIANAIKFRRDGVAPKVYISSVRQDNMWVFSVVDNGIGIDSEQAEGIFQIFQRLHTEEEYPGLGMGLALCKRIVEHHGGRIWVEPASREGATFRFSIPVSTAGNAEI